MSITRPEFHGAFMGYNKVEVNNHISRLETELTECEEKAKTLEENKKNWEDKIGVMELDSIRLTNEITSKEERVKELEEQVKEQEKQIAELQSKLREYEASIEKVENEKKDLKKSYEESEYNPKLIQEAILNAQTLGKQIVGKANLEAGTIVDRANTAARKVVTEAERKCERLQENYNQILMDATGFKSELMALYRRHMELLTAFPEREVKVIDVESVEEMEEALASDNSAAVTEEAKTETVVKEEMLPDDEVTEENAEDAETEKEMIQRSWL